MRFLAVDDEPYALKDLVEALTETFPDDEVKGFTGAQGAMDYVGEAKVDVAFLDIEMGYMDGIILAKNLKDIQPDIHIIFVTSHEKYAVDAFAIHANGYLLKPVYPEEIRNELEFIYGKKMAGSQKEVRIQTFGGFRVFVNEQPITFRRSKSKELLAYLVDRRGADITTREACAVLWEDKNYDNSLKNYFQSIVHDLRQTLRQAGIEDIMIKKRNSFAILPDKFECDSYLFLKGDVRAVNSYRHDYMNSYSWSEFTIGLFEEKIK